MQCNVTTSVPKWVQKERRARRNAMTGCPKWVYRGKGPGGPRWSHWRLPTRHEEQGNAPTKDYQSMTLCLSSSSPSSLPSSSSTTSSSLLRYIKYISYIRPPRKDIATIPGVNIITIMWVIQILTMTHDHQVVNDQDNDDDHQVVIDQDDLPQPSR